jgi:hypothetical protein
MTDEELNAIEARANVAESGPWSPIGDKLCTGVGSLHGDIASQGALNHKDAIFIAHAREDVPALVNEVLRLRTLLEDIRSKSCSLTLREAITEALK